MKYIRTKDGIYDLDKSIWHEFTGRKVKIPYCEEYEKQLALCRTADTIEELCDEFVLENEIKDDEKYSVLTKSQFAFFKKAIIETIPVTKQKCFGAVWTDKGLIYVAKINDKGELELL